MLVHGGASQCEGIYRKPGSVVRMKAAVEHCQATGAFPLLGQIDEGGLLIHDVACMQKKFIRDMPGAFVSVRSFLVFLCTRACLTLPPSLKDAHPPLVH